MIEKYLVKPTATPALLYTPPDPMVINLIIGLGVLIFLIVLFGVWLNRSKLNH